MAASEMGGLGRRRLILFGSACAILALGLWSRFSGAGDSFVHNHLGAILYNVLLICVGGLVLRTDRVLFLGVLVFCFTATVELLQLVNVGWLQALREHDIGRLILGANGGFDWWDFPLYLVGTMLGMLWLRLLNRLIRGDVRIAESKKKAVLESVRR